MIDHDVKPGPLHHCQVCGSEDLRQIIDLGHQPLCDALLTSDQLNAPELTYPLRLNQCANCSLAQLDYVVSGRDVYPASYPYRAGISWPVVEAHKAMATEIVDRFGRGFVVDIGSNDGTLLKQFQRLGCDVVGVEPTGIAGIAARDGVPTVRAFFSEATACYIAAKAHIITLTNVFAHMADLGEVMRGICTLLDEDGVLVIENHYLLDILQTNQFDSIYHEHVRTYTLRSLIVLFAQYGMQVFEARRVSRYGGNIRVHVCWDGNRPIDASVGDMLATESAAGTYQSGWHSFARRVKDQRDAFRAFVRKHKAVGCSAPGRASTLLNYYGADAETLAWTGEIDGSLKIGQFLPGCHIPVVSNKRLVDEQPEHVVLLAWHYADEIAARLRREGVRSKLYAPLPTYREIAA